MLGINRRTLFRWRCYQYFQDKWAEAVAADKAADEREPVPNNRAIWGQDAAECAHVCPVHCVWR